MDYKEKVIALLNSKELSKEQKEKLEDIFPELVESEDERMKSAAIEFVIQNKSFNYYLGISKDDVVTWINRQGETDQIIEKAKTEKQRVLLTETNGNANIDWDCRSLDDVKVLLKCGLEFIRTIEANKQILTDSRFGGCYFRVPTRYDKGIKQGEQKPTDKVEPKFKIGNWYQCIKDFFGKGVTFDKNTAYYCAKEGCLQDEYGCHIAIVKDLYDNFKLWTIKDAKDGDVLCCESGWTCIFKKLNHNSFGEILFDSYCFIDRTGWFCDGAKGHTLNERINGKIYPATKEQCDLLFQKIKESGYEWDAEKKELKNVSQEYPLTPDECVKPNWSGEDEKIMQNLLSLWKEVMIEPTCCRFGLHKDEIVDWFKSLKDRVQLKQEWSEEDEDMCYKATAVMNRLCAEGKEYVWSINTLKKLFYWLKSLGHRSQWKPSDEQMDALLYVVRNYTPGVTERIAWESIKTLELMFKDLKKLKGEEV